MANNCSFRTRTRRAPERSLRKQQQSKLACVQKRQSLRLGDVIDGVGVKEWIERLGGPAHGRECITCGPAIDFSDVFDKKCGPKLVAQGNAPQSDHWMGLAPRRGDPQLPPLFDASAMPTRPKNARQKS